MTPLNQKSWKQSPSMQYIVKHRKTICGFLIILVLFELLLVYIMINNYRENYLSRDDAIEALVEETGISKEEMLDFDSDFETDNGTAWFEVSFTKDGTEYNYKVDAETGQVSELSD